MKGSNFVTSDQVGGIVRALLSAAIPLAIAKGYIDNDTATTMSAAFTTLVVSGWSLYTNRQSGMIQSINGKDNGVKVVPEFSTTAPKVDGPLK